MALDLEGLLNAMKESEAKMDKYLRRLQRMNPFKGFPKAAKAMGLAEPSRRIVALAKALDQGANPDAVAPDGETAASMALAACDLAALRLLDNRGARFPDLDLSALHRAVLFGDAAAVTAAATPDACTTPTLRGQTALTLACQFGRLDLLAILHAQTPPEARAEADAWATNALMLAARYGHLERVR